VLCPAFLMALAYQNVGSKCTHLQNSKTLYGRLISILQRFGEEESVMRYRSALHRDCCSRSHSFNTVCARDSVWRRNPFSKLEIAPVSKFKTAAPQQISSGDSDCILVRVEGLPALQGFHGTQLLAGTACATGTGDDPATTDVPPSASSSSGGKNVNRILKQVLLSSCWFDTPGDVLT